MSSEFILVEEVTAAEGAVGVKKGDVPELIDVSFLLMASQCLISVEFLLFEDACFFLNANVAILMSRYQT